MNIADILKQLKAFARQDGAILFAVWAASFFATLLLPQSPWGNLLALSTPFVVAWRLRRFRDDALEGVISFRRALAYTWYTFFYAAIAFALTQYLYFQFWDNGTLSNFIMQSISALGPMYADMGMKKEELDEAVKLLTELSPIQLSFLFLMQNLFIGLLLGLPIAAICTRSIAKQR